MQSRNVPFFNYQRVFSDHEEDYTRIMKDVLKRGAFILQKDLADFEQHIKDYLGVKHVFGLANGTDALIIAFRAAGLKPGDEVIFPSHTFVASPSSVALLGGVPVPVECGADHMLDPEVIEAAITPKTKFIMPVQINGRTCNMDAICRIADKHNLKIVEDSAQGLGSKYKGKFAGTFGVAGTFSFYPAKILGCFGDGGAIITNDDKMAEQILLMRDHGRNHDGRVVMWGYNSRLDNLQAAILDYNFKDFDGIIRRRRELASLYQKELGQLSALVLPPAPDAHPDHFDTYQNYEIEADRRDELKDFLKANGIGTLIQWGGTAVHQFTELGFKQKLPITEKMFSRFLMLPMNTMVSNEDALYVCAKIKEFYQK